MATDPTRELRQAMVEVAALHAHLAQERLGKETLDPRVLAAMAKVPRHEFVPAEMRPYAYLDQPLPIGYGKTVSQPFMAALMADLLDLRPEDRVLEIGTGRGYHAAVLAELAAEIFTIEIVAELAAAAKRTLARLGYETVRLRTGDGAWGWPDHAPFDKILVAAGSELIPPMLLPQLKPGGRMVVPTGTAEAQELMVVDKSAGGKIATRTVLSVRFAMLETAEEERPNVLS
ncbi:MAG: protein-L-isoaspartate(D-aspartate) O-methyltransferase [Rhodospirillaceae bacterium]|nr:protein-L-isoaspartate(D-aspartate) O-methyltransferase [Rhodospirillaceae bacterium]